MTPARAVALGDTTTVSRNGAAGVAQAETAITPRTAWPGPVAVRNARAEPATGSGAEDAGATTPGLVVTTGPQRVPGQPVRSSSMRAPVVTDSVRPESKLVKTYSAGSVVGLVGTVVASGEMVVAVGGDGVGGGPVEPGSVTGGGRVGATPEPVGGVGPAILAGWAGREGTGDRAGRRGRRAPSLLAPARTG